MLYSLSVTYVRSVVFFTNKTDRHDVAEILLKVALNNIKQITKQTNNVISNEQKVCLSGLCFEISLATRRQVRML